MSDEPFYSPNRKPPPPPKPTPGERARSLVKGTDVGFSVGVTTAAGSLDEAAAAKRQHEADGWIEKGDGR